jgi:hypothetical protein
MDKKEMSKFEEMLAKLADAYPELEEKIADLQVDLSDLDEGKDIGSLDEEEDEGMIMSMDDMPAPAIGEDEVEEDDEASLEIEIEAPSKKRKKAIPPELMD